MPDLLRRNPRRLAAAILLAALASACGSDPDWVLPPGGGGTPYVYAATNVPIGIPDGAGGGHVTSYLPVSGAPTSISKVTVRVTITHTRTDDVYFTLYSPEGSQVALSWGNGTYGQNYTDTVFDDAAATSIIDGYPPFHGTYRPQWPLSIVNGDDANGTWRLELWDMFPGDVGTLQSWSIQIW